MVLPIILAQSAEGGNVLEQTALRFGFNGWLFLSQAFSFTVVCVVLYNFAYKRILNVLEERRRTIEQGLTDAAKIKEELASAEQRSAEIVRKASDDAQKLIEEARLAAKSFQEKQSQHAVREAEQIVAKAREASELDRQRMFAELKQEVARLVVDTTVKVTGKVLTPDDQRRLSEEASREIAA
jgi:F-type H+-transporting ATPase subunit b